MVGAFLVVASTASLASAASFVKDWHAPSPQGIAVGGAHVYVAAHGLESFTTHGDPAWADPGRAGACSVAFRHSDGHVFVGTCQSRQTTGDGVYQYNAEGRLMDHIVALPGNLSFSYIQAVAVHEGNVYFSDLHNKAVIRVTWPNQAWDTPIAFPAQGLALTANRVYAIKHDVICYERYTHCYPSYPSPGRVGDGPGSGNGQFNKPQGIAVGGLHGHVYVADTGNNRIQEFTHNGAFLNAWTSPGPGGGSFSAPMDVGVDPHGHVYVADTGNNRIVKFTP